MSYYRLFCILGGVVYILLFYLLERITYIPFISYKPFWYVLAIIWVIICIVVAVIKTQKKDDEFFKS